MPDKDKTPKGRIGITFRCDRDVYAEITDVMCRLRMRSFQRFMEQAVARELAYNARRGKRKGA